MGTFANGGRSNPSGILLIMLGFLLGWLLVLRYQAREMSRMFSAVTLGAAALSVTIKGRNLFGQYLLFGLALIGAYLVLMIGGLVVLGTLASDLFAGGDFDAATIMAHMRGSFVTTVALITGYLLIVATFSLMSELFLGLGFWQLVATGASITNVDSLRSVQARGEDKALAGEGLADALNVGAY